MLQKLTFALDRSARTIDADGRMHVAACNISKACVNDYYGREIPSGEALGLDANTVYPVLRCPDALEASVPTFNNVPLMDEHVIVSAAEPEKDRIVGSTGTDAEFNGEFLRNSLVIWDQDMIDRIESGEQKEISCAYRYEPVLTSGTFKGFPFSLKMIGIVANHVALVPKGRAGPDVVVSDSELDQPMTKRLTSKKALFAQGGIAATLAPLIAADAKPDILGALQGVNRANFKAMKATVADRLGKDKAITADALSAVKVALDAMEKEDCGEDDEMSGMDEETEEEEKKAKDKAAKDAKEAEDKAARDEEEKKAKDAKDAELQAGKPPMTKGMDRATMDAAIATAVSKVRDETRAATIAEFNAIAAAKTDVVPLVGEITAAMDSAVEVYKFALDHAGVTLDGTESVSALKTMVKMAADRAEPALVIANDAKPGEGIVDRFPDLRRLRG